MSYTLGEASKATGKHITTISKAIKKGRISAIRKDDGSYDIDPAELHRVYPPIEESRVGQPLTSQHHKDEILPKVKELELRLEAERKQNSMLQSQVDDLKEDRDKWRQQATGLLTDERSRKERSLWQRLLGSGNAA